jgi:addiction module RelE/StbE family toxin
MPLTLKFSDRARRDLLEILDYLQRRNHAGAKAVLRAIERSSLLLAERPLSARRTDFEGIRVRTVAQYPYLIFYQVDGNHLYVVHVRHSARKPATKKELG